MVSNIAAEHAQLNAVRQHFEPVCIYEQHAETSKYTRI
jgi:hypothetical protein